LTVKLRTKNDPGRIMMYPMHRTAMTELPGIERISVLVL
jgi:hypothetical protein